MFKGLVFLLGFLCLTGNSEAYSEAYYSRVADAIYRAEGGNKTRYPYGILSVKVSSEKEARKVCLEVIRFRYELWSTPHNGRPAPKKSKSFIQYLSESYCPVGADNDPTGLNKNWTKNVSRFLGEN